MDLPDLSCWAAVAQLSSVMNYSWLTLHSMETVRGEIRMKSVLCLCEVISALVSELIGGGGEAVQQLLELISSQ